MQNQYNKERETDNVKDKVGDYASTAMKEGEQKIRSVVADAEKQLRQGEEKFRRVVADVDKQLHENPWPIVTGVAAGCLLLGFIMGTSKRNS
jgi:ElaB/YqjD/DUF883 family membrane-anchored ribosome-binding protein